MSYTVSFFNSKSLKQCGFPQQTVFYYNNKSKELSNVADMPVFKGRLDLYTSAPVDAELDKYLPNGVTLKLKSGLWSASYDGSKKLISRNHEFPLDAKADLILKLFKERLITF